MLIFILVVIELLISIELYVFYGKIYNRILNSGGPIETAEVLYLSLVLIFIGLLYFIFLLMKTLNKFAK